MGSQVMASAAHPLGGHLAKSLGAVSVAVASTVPEHVRRGDVPRCADKCAERGIAERHNAWTGGIGRGQPDLAALD